MKQQRKNESIRTITILVSFWLFLLSTTNAFNLSSRIGSVIDYHVGVNRNKSHFRNVHSSLFNGNIGDGEGSGENGGGNNLDKRAPKEGDDWLTSFRKWLKTDEAKEDFKVYTISLATALLFRFFIIEPRYIPSLSMYPTFDVGDQLAVEKVTKRFRPYLRNEIVVFQPPEAFQEIMNRNYIGKGINKKSKEALIKRIVATEGDNVRITNGKLYINEEKQDEPFTAEDANYDFGPIVVPPGNLLVLGDNRNRSLDGHIWGFLPTRNVIGRAVFTYWPPWRIGNSGMF